MGPRNFGEEHGGFDPREIGIDVEEPCKELSEESAGIAERETDEEIDAWIQNVKNHGFVEISGEIYRVKVIDTETGVVTTEKIISAEQQYIEGEEEPLKAEEIFSKAEVVTKEGINKKFDAIIKAKEEEIAQSEATLEKLKNELAYMQEAADRLRSTEMLGYIQREDEDLAEAIKAQEQNIEKVNEMFEEKKQEQELLEVKKREIVK